MSIQERRARERADRHRLIVRAARELAEAEGWDAVTTRRLAEKVEYSQPVLYSHFKGKDAIVQAVAIEGFGELGALMRSARVAQKDAEGALRGLSEAYLDFARTRPALYEAMFMQPIDVAFGQPETPAELRSAFAEFLTALKPVAGDQDLETLAEVTWSALHGLASLTQGHRLRPDRAQARLDILMDRLVSPR